MSELPDTEQLLAPAEAVEAWASRHGRAHFTERQLQHWRRHGVLAPNGERVRLCARKLGRRFYFTLREIDEFARAVANADADVGQPSSAPPQGARQRGPARGRANARMVADAEQLLDRELGAA